METICAEAFGRHDAGEPYAARLQRRLDAGEVRIVLVVHESNVMLEKTMDYLGRIAHPQMLVDL